MGQTARKRLLATVRPVYVRHMPDEPAPYYVYSFRYRDPRAKKWVLARYMASEADIAASYAQWEIVGHGELRTPMGYNYFVPYAVDLVAPRPRPIGQHLLDIGPHRRKPPGIDASERRLVGVFLRRLIVYEARRRRFEQVRNAVDLLAEVAGVHV
jgi:hypothetical protein